MNPDELEQQLIQLLGQTPRGQLYSAGGQVGFTQTNPPQPLQQLQARPGDLSGSYVDPSTGQTTYIPLPRAQTGGITPEKLQALQAVAQNIKALPQPVQEEILRRLGFGPQEEIKTEFQLRQKAARGEPEAQRVLQQFATEKQGEKEVEARTKAGQKLVSEERGYKWLDPKTGSELPADVTLDEARKIGKRVSNKDFDSIQSSFSGLDQINKYRSLLPRLGLAKEPGILSTRGAQASIFMKRQQGDPLVKQWDALKAGISQIVQALGGDRRITDAERTLVFQSIPGDNDTLKGAEDKLNQLEDLLALAIKRRGIPLPKQAEEPESPRSTAPATQQGWQDIGGGIRIRPKGR